jgi:hypothetical protein
MCLRSNLCASPVKVFCHTLHIVEFICVLLVLIWLTDIIRLHFTGAPTRKWGGDNYGERSEPKNFLLAGGSSPPGVGAYAISEYGDVMTDFEYEDTLANHVVFQMKCC